MCYSRISSEITPCTVQSRLYSENVPATPLMTATSLFDPLVGKLLRARILMYGRYSRCNSASTHRKFATCSDRVMAHTGVVSVSPCTQNCCYTRWCVKMKQSGIVSFDSRTKQEAQLLLGDRATRKHAKDSWNGRGNDNLGWMTFKCTSRSSKVAPIES